MADPVVSDRYRIVRHLALGGMADVYLAHDQLLDRPVAVKVMLAELAQDASFVERFRREAKSAANLNHPNIVSVYDFGERGSAYFIVMEYVPGETLRDIIHRDGPMEPAGAVAIAADVAAALAAAHRQGIIHRDVKPDNVLMSGGVAKVADFGIARARDELGEGLTMPGSAIGTASYSSPEQAQGLAVDNRSDLYSLGMVLYEMLAGRPPFPGDNPVSVAYQQASGTPPPPSTYNRSVPPALDALVARAMARNPADRQPTADEMRSELLAVGPGPAGAPTEAFGLPAAAAGDATSVMAVPAPAPTASVRPPGPTPLAVYRRRRMTVLVVLIVLVLAGAAVVAALANHGTTTPTTTVPNVVGLRVADAVAAVARVNLKSQVVGVQPGAPDLVAQQDPNPGAQVSRDSTVTLVVAPPSTTTTVVRRTIPPTSRPTTTQPVPTTQAPPTTGVTVTAVPTITQPPPTT